MTDDSRHPGPVDLEDLTLFYQPQMSSDGMRVASVEALLRLEHPTKGRFGPGAFLEQFAHPEKLDALDWWVLNRACDDAKRWPSISVGVNVSAVQFRNADFAGRVIALLQEKQLPAGRLELEIVEGAYIEDFETASANVAELRKAGVRIALDDFGTGYSSLSYLLRLPIDKLKIDKSFVDKVGSMQSAAIVHAIVALARALGMKVTAEGVETEAQHEFLRSAGCHFMQGFLFSGAVSADGISRMLARDNAPPELLLNDPLLKRPAA